MTRKIIACAGAINAGKDTIMDKLKVELSKKSSYPVIRTRFADSLNQSVSAILGVGIEELQDRELKEKKRFTFGENRNRNIVEWSSRDVQKHFGMFFRDTLGENVFIKALENRFKAMSDAVIIISDLRYQNELDWVQQNGGIVVYVHNEQSATIQMERESVGGVGSFRREHIPPESELLQWEFYHKRKTPDFWLDNNNFNNIKPFNEFVKFVKDYLVQ